MYIQKELIKMRTTIQKWGNSQGVRIPKRQKNRKNLKELFKDYNGEYESVEIDWGEEKGKEIW
jgi:hypothetical protein